MPRGLESNSKLRRTVQCALNFMDQCWDWIQSHPRHCLGMVCGLLLMQVGSSWYPTLDSTNYLSISRSLIAPGPMQSLDSPRVDIPLGYSILISPAFLFGDRPFLALSIIQFVLMVVGLLGVYRWAQRQIPRAAVLTTCLVMVNAGVWFYYRRNIKEIAFLAFAIWTVNTLTDVLQAADRGTRVRTGILAVLLSCFLVTIRYAGIVIPAAFGALLLWQTFRRKCAPRLALTLILCVACPSAVLLLGQVMYHRTMAATYGGRDYLKGFSQRTSTAKQTTSQRLTRTAHMRLHGITRVVAPGMFKTDPSLVNNHAAVAVGEILVLLMILWGCWKLAQNHDLLAISFPLYMALYLAWPFDSGGRFLVSMTPILIGSLVLAWQPYAAGRRLHILGVVAHTSVALGYWLLIDLPRAQEINAEWPIVDRIITTIQDDPGQLEVEQRQLQPLLQLAGNSVVLYSRSWHSSTKNRPLWLLLDDGKPIPSGFVQQRRIGSYQLLHRLPAPRESQTDTTPARTAKSRQKRVY